MAKAVLLRSILIALIGTLPALAEVAENKTETTKPEQAQGLIGIPASPAAVDPTPGTGALGRWLGLPADSAWSLSGVWVGNGSDQLGGAGSNGALQLRVQPGFVRQPDQISGGEDRSKQRFCQSMLWCP